MMRPFYLTWKKGLITGLCVFWGCGLLRATQPPPALAEGLQAFQDHRWLDAMADFLAVLRTDPNNAEAHKYVPLTLREIEAQNQAVVREIRLSLLSGASQRLGKNQWDTRPLEAALEETTHSEEHVQEERWTRWLEESKVERQMNRLLAANDLVLRIIAEKPNHVGAQQELSLLQSDSARALQAGSDLLVQERYALEGFYAYGQGDYATASTAWKKARALVQQTYAAPQAAQQLAALHFESYATRADAAVEEKNHEAQIATLFNRGMELYQKKRFAQALEAFRQVAFAKPEYPQLAYYLVQAENGVEKERTRLLTEAKRRDIATTLGKGVDFMEHEKYPEAREAFHRVLALDPSNPSAHSYLTVVEAEIQRLHDPKTAQIHYEAGLVAYASGKLEEAVREWRIASRMDPQNGKAVNALAKVQKELVLSKEMP